MDLHELEMIAKSDDNSNENENELKQSKKELNKKDSELESLNCATIASKTSIGDSSTK